MLNLILELYRSRSKSPLHPGNAGLNIDVPWVEDETLRNGLINDRSMEVRRLRSEYLAVSFRQGEQVSGGLRERGAFADSSGGKVKAR